MYIFNILFYRIDGFSFEWVEMFPNVSQIFHTKNWKNNLITKML